MGAVICPTAFIVKASPDSEEANLPIQNHPLSYLFKGLKGAWPQIQVKFHMPFLILTVLYHGISNGHTEFEFQILS
jgi:hypothetical protein